MIELLKFLIEIDWKLYCRLQFRVKCIVFTNKIDKFFKILEVDDEFFENFDALAWNFFLNDGRRQMLESFLKNFIMRSW